MDPDLYCDVEALTTLANQLTTIHDQLARAGDISHQYDRQLGSNRLENAIHDFIEGWKDGRKKIEGEVEGLAKKAAGAAATYQENEQRLIDATKGKGK